MATLIPRSAMVLRPKAPLKVWLDSLPKAQAGSLPPFKDDPLLFLIPDMDSVEEIQEWLEENFDFFFLDVLGSWWTDKETFPKDRTFDLFKAWFDVEVHPLVEDACEPVEEETEA